jgi:hypothetical protein
MSRYQGIQCCPVTKAYNAAPLPRHTMLPHYQVIQCPITKAYNIHKGFWTFSPAAVEPYFAAGVGDRKTASQSEAMETSKALV